MANETLKIRCWRCGEVFMVSEKDLREEMAVYRESGIAAEEKKVRFVEEYAGEQTFVVKCSECPAYNEITVEFLKASS